jgi:hypothetical protein
VEDIVGTLAFLPLIYPYEPWRFKHDQHHAKTNMYVTFPIELSQAIRKKKYGLLSANCLIPMYGMYLETHAHTHIHIMFHVISPFSQISYYMK